MFFENDNNGLKPTKIQSQLLMVCFEEYDGNGYSHDDSIIKFLQ